MQLSDLISHFEKAHYLTNRKIQRSNIDISKICYDSRSVEGGAIFFAVPGVHVDGHDYIEAAKNQGCSTVVLERDLEPFSQHFPNINFLEVKNVKAALSLASAAYYQFPVNDLTIIGVTGTDGKSSTVSFISQLLKLEGVKVGHISTVSMEAGSGFQSNNLRQSTPEAPEIHGLLADMRDNGITVAVVEATSHGLSHKTARLLHVEFDCAVFTNITHEHLEFHGSFEQYRDDKTNLFRSLRSKNGNAGLAVLNYDDKSSFYIKEQIQNPINFYSLEQKNLHTQLSDEANEHFMTLSTIKSAIDHCKATAHWNNKKATIQVNMPGLFNLENAMASILAVAFVLNKDPLDLIHFAEKLHGVKGRMLPINQGQGFYVIVDYAHTPGSFERVFPIFRSNAPKRLISVFGSAGERDIEKRAIQGAIAAKYSDVLVLCDEDPRLEDSMKIIDQIAQGALVENPTVKIIKISDRRKAIEQAFRIAEIKDTVVMLGKGHEQSIIYAQGKQAWDEEAVAREVLDSMGFSKR
jgi:UDP-N-acetylmuramoyl-L-alanyl-D-glutamate--2,6-diaminopimelate ligase